MPVTPVLSFARLIPVARRCTRAIGIGVLLCGLIASGGSAAAASMDRSDSGVGIGAGAGAGGDDGGGGDGTSGGDRAVDAPGYPWSWPVAGPRRVIAPFRAPAHEYGPGHRGMDIAAELGADVRAPADGVVAFRGTVVDRPLLTLDTGDSHIITLAPMDSSLLPGEVVEAGTVIGTVAVGGHAVRGALHVGVRVGGDYVNPRPLFGEVPRAVLLPCCE